MSIETLESLLKNPDIWDIELSTQNMHDVLVEIASRVDALMSNQEKNKTSNNDNEQQAFDVQDINSRIDALSKQLERQNTDFGSEMQDLRALFNFQIRDVREKMDRNFSNIKESMSRPSTPPTTVIQQIPDTDANFELERKVHSLSKDISHLKEKIRAIVTVINDLQIPEKDSNTDDENKSPEKKENKIDIEPTSSNKLLLDEPPDVDITLSSRNTNDDPLSPHDEDFTTSRIKDSRYDDIIEDIEFMKKERKNDVERLNSTIKAVNQLIAEKDNNTNKINQCSRDSKRFNDEFDRLYQKMAEFQVEVDKKISEALNIRISSDFKPSATPGNQPLELPDLKENVTDENYKQQINYLKLEVAQLKQALADGVMLIPNSDKSVSRSNAEVQTDEKLSDDIPTHHANIDVQKNRIANEINTQVIVSRTPIQFMAINQDAAALLKKLQQSPQTSTSEKPQSTKRQRRPISTSSIEIQTNEDRVIEQPDVNPPNDYDSENHSRVISTASSTKTDDGRSKRRLKSSNSNRRVTYIDSTTETQAEISGIGSPLRTPPRTPLRSQKQKRNVELIDILIETDPDITGEPLGITPDLLINSESSRTESNINKNQESEDESDSEEEEKDSTKRVEREKSPVEVSSESNVDDKGKADDSKKERKKRKKRKSKKGKDLQTPDDSQKIENEDSNNKNEDNSPNAEQTLIDNAGTEVKTKTPLQQTRNEESEKANQSEHSTPQNEPKVKKDDESTAKTDQAPENPKDEDNQDSTSEHSTKAGTPQTKPASRTETPKVEKEEENQNNKSDTKNSKKKHVTYADSGISMQINTYEKEIKDRTGDNSEDGDEVEVVDIEIQTDEISEEELNMYSIFNQENHDMMTGMGDMSYMEKYSSSGANTSIGYQSPQKANSGSSMNNLTIKNNNNQIYRPQQQPYYFSFEHLLSLTIISEYTQQPATPQQGEQQKQQDFSNTQGNEKQQVDLSNVDIQAIVNQVLELSKDKSFLSLAENVNKHTQQIDTIFNTLDEIKNVKHETINRPATNNKVASEKETKISNQNPSNTTSSITPIPQQSNTNNTNNVNNTNIANINNNTNRNASNVLIVVADVQPDQNHLTTKTASADDVDEINERLDEVDISITALEEHVYSLEKKLINKGAIRPNSSDPFDDDTNPYGSNKMNYSPTKYKESDHHRHHHHHHPHKSTRRSEPDESEIIKDENDNNVQPTPQNPNDTNKSEPENPQRQTTNENVQSNESDKYNNNNINKEPEDTSNHVVAIASGPDKPKTSKYYNQFTPGSLSQQKNQEAKKETLEFIPGFTIDPEVQVAPTTQEQFVIPEDLTLPKYERQFRLLREAVVELRTNIQILRVKTDQPVIIQPTENVEVEPETQKSEPAVDESTIRALRKKIEMTFEDYSSQIADIRRELYTHLEQPPDRIIEVRTEVQTVAKSQNEEDDTNDKNNSKQAAQAPKDINVDLNLSKAIEMLSDTQHKNVISIHKIELPPEVKEHRDLYQRLQQNNPIVEGSMNENQPLKPTSDLLQPPAPQQQQQQQGNNDQNNQTFDYEALPPPLSTPLVTVEKNEGHYVPQIVQDMRVLNAMPKKDMLELLMPFLYQLRSELLLNIDSNTERIRCLEASVQSKVDKEFIESFFRKIRLAVKEADEKAMRACNSLFDKVSKQDLEDRVQELLKQIGSQETTVAGKTSYTCLFCGAKRNAVSKSSLAMDKGKIFKGRANRQSLQAGELSQLPPLSENE